LFSIIKEHALRFAQGGSRGEKASSSYPATTLPNRADNLPRRKDKGRHARRDSLRSRVRIAGVVADSHNNSTLLQLGIFVKTLTNERAQIILSSCITHAVMCAK
jgi:hypothetical protein